jgi:sugar lactone lactonase YvrE
MHQFLCFALAFAFALLAGCSATRLETPQQEEKIQLLWPAPPAPTQFAYEITLRSPADVQKETKEQELRRKLTGISQVSDAPIYKKPAGLAARKGRIYVADPLAESIVVFDVPRQRVFRIGVREPNRVYRPIALALDGKDNVYVLDSKLRRVMVFDSLGLFLYAVGDPKELVQPVGVAVSDDGSKVFVVDRGTVELDDHKVVAYAPDGSELFRIGPRGSEPGQVNIPLAATVAPDGTLLVLDSGNFRVQAFNQNGRFQFEFGSVGTGIGQFARPRGIAAGPDGTIYVADASFNNVQIFDPKGQLLMWLGTHGMRNAPGGFGLIADITVDETGRLYIADHFHNKIEVYRREQPDGTQAATR